MRILFIISIGLFVALGLYLIMLKVFRLPSSKANKAIQNMHGKTDILEKIEKSLIPFAKLLSKILPMSEYKISKMQADFKRINFNKTPQLFVSMIMLKSMLFGISGLLFIPLGLPLFSLLSDIIALLMYFRSMQTLQKQVQELNQEIESEMPRLVEMLMYSLNDNRDLIVFFEKYRKVSGKALGSELDRLLIDLKTGNQITALRNMDARLNIPSFSALCAILSGVHQGVDQYNGLQVLEQDMRVKEREFLKMSMAKRPTRIKTASLILTILMILMFMIPMVLMIADNLKGVGF